MSAEIIIRKEGRTGRMTLNRPQALHAVTLAICERVIETLRAWEEDGTALALIDHAGGRGFSAGGDIRWLYEKIRTDPASAKRFFFVEYQMNHLLFTSPLPLVSFMDGVAMGGGAGLALPCRYRVATENTRFAMPEAGIGLFPDVGGGWYLPRLPDGLGLRLALTGDRLNGEACVDAGVATHFIESGKLDEVKAELVARPEAVEEILASSSSPACGRGRCPIASSAMGEVRASQAALTRPRLPPMLRIGSPLFSRSAGEEVHGGTS
jgi:enoyl-CoA hydratase